MIPALKAAIAHWSGSANWAPVRPPLVALTKEQAASPVSNMKEKSFNMPGLGRKRTPTRVPARIAGALLGLGVVLFGADTSSAQPAAKAPVIGLLDGGERLEWWAAFRGRLRALGYAEGRDVAFEPRYARGNFDRLPGLAEDLVRLKVTAIVTSGRVATQAAMRATSAIPIVTATGDDPVNAGLVASLGRPGGNVTGVTSLGTGLIGKRFEVLAEVIPNLSRLAVLWDMNNPTAQPALRELEAVAQPAKVNVQRMGVKSGEEIADAFAAMTRERAQAVFVISDPMLYSERRRLAELALKHRLPSIHSAPDYVEAGGGGGVRPLTPPHPPPCVWFCCLTNTTLSTSIYGLSP